MHLIVLKIELLHNAFNQYTLRLTDIILLAPTFCLQVDRSLVHDSCDCDMCVDEEHVVKIMKHLLMIQKLMLIKLMFMKLMLTKHKLIKTMWIKAMFKYVDENHVDRRQRVFH